MIRLVDFLSALNDDTLVMLYIGKKPFVGYWPLARLRTCFNTDCPIVCTDIKTNEDGSIRIYLDKESIV